MVFLYIVCGILLVVCLLLIVKVSFGISWCNGLLMEIKIGFIKRAYDLSSKAEAEEEPQSVTGKKQKVPVKKSKVKLTEVLKIIQETVAELYKKTKKHIFLSRFILKIDVASQDPMVTGVLYGSVSAAASSLLVFIEGLNNVSSKKGSIYVEVKPDFFADKPDVFVDILLTTRVWRVLSMVRSLYQGYNKYKALSNAKGD